ncbi:MAG TPA: FadR/GntR family transcriptional regulator [Candidatus Acidoferrales bacterium]|nr:FadR/GntR family transcriptional regulator [Candidatus Acidoferrales bacterium]
MSERATFTTIGNRELLSKTVAQKIEDAIHARVLKSGDRLAPEFDLAAQFDVSRTVIREALRTLSARGIVAIKKGKGVFVKGYSAESVVEPLHSYLRFSIQKDYALDVIHARQIIEPAIAYVAALRHTSEDASKLQSDWEELKNCPPNDHSELARLDLLFHLDIARATHNIIIPLMIEPIHRLMPAIKISVYNAVRNSKDSAVEKHGKVLSAILKRDAEGARRAMTIHLNVAEEHVKLTVKSGNQKVEKN